MEHPSIVELHSKDGSLKSQILNPFSTDAKPFLIHQFDQDHPKLLGIESPHTLGS